MENHSGRTDHDILIEVATKLDRAITDIKEMDRNFTKTAADKVDRTSFEAWSRDFRKDLNKEFEEMQKSITTGFTAQTKVSDDHEQRIRRVERWGFVAIGALTIIQLVISLN